MIKQLDIDDETLALIRRADPLDDPRAASHTLRDTESALRVAHVQINRPGPTRRRTRRGLALGGVAIGTTAVAVVALNVGSSGHGSLSHALNDAGLGTQNASAATVKTRALDVLKPGPGSILVVDETSTQDNGDGTSESWGYQYWSSTTYPYANRIIQTQAGSPAAESAMTSGGYQELYDPSTNTIYEYKPAYSFTPGGTAGTEQLTVPSYDLLKKVDTPASAELPAGDTGTTTLTITAAQVSALKTGADEIAYKNLTDDAAAEAVIGSEPYVAQNHGYAIDPASQWATPIEKLLNDPSSSVDRSASYDGQPAIEISSTTSDGTISYWVAPGSYRPLQEITTGQASNGQAQTVTVTSSFPTYETLSGAAASPSLLSLAAQHAGAKLDTNPSDYEAAESSLYANG